MPRDEVELKAMLKKAAQVIKEHPTLKVPEAMRVAKLHWMSPKRRLEIDFLAEARTSGFIIYPSVPNTTAVTQETDQLYGPFKSKFAQNLRALSGA